MDIGSNDLISALEVCKRLSVKQVLIDESIGEFREDKIPVIRRDIF